MLSNKIVANSNTSNKIDEFERFLYYRDNNQLDSATLSLLIIEKKMINDDKKFNIKSYVHIMTLLSGLYAQRNLLRESEIVIDRAERTIRLKGYGDSPLMRFILMQRGQLSLIISDTEEAKSLILKAKSLFERENDYYSIHYISCLHNLALIYHKKGMYWFCKILLDDILIRFKNVDSKSISDSQGMDRLKFSILNTIALNYESIGDYEQSIKYRKKSIRLAKKKNLIKEYYLGILNSLYYEIVSGNYKNAIKYLDEFENLDWDYLEKDYAYQTLFFPLYYLDDMRVFTIMENYISYFKNSITSVLSTFSESERDNYWREKSGVINSFINSLCLKYQTPQATIMSYNNSLFTKTFLTRSSKIFKEYVINNSSEIIRNNYRKMIELEKESRGKDISDELYLNHIEKIKSIEREILLAIKNYKMLFNDSCITWENIQKTLLSDEIAIEFNLFCEYLPNGYQINYYGALIVSPHMDCPKFVKLCKKKDLNAILRKGQRTESQLLDELYSLDNETLYNLVFKPIEKYIDGSTTIYYSPVGKLHRINMQAISNNGKRLMERYKMHRVSSTSKLLERQRVSNDTKFSSAFLIGGVDYDEDLNIMASESEQYNIGSMESFTAMRSLDRGSWDPLPGSLHEVSEIHSILNNRGIKTYMLNGSKANEESVKNLDGNSPDIIHIATHGFFFEGNSKTPNSIDKLNIHSDQFQSMYYSGLLLAGANNIWYGEKELPRGIEDGILTAEEISHLDFSNTNLTVLSACETGLGEIDDIDGVYGLQRGFKMAGVETILMCLWKIPDEATQILMVEFYRNLMRGKNKYQSLKDAQKYLRQVDNGKYDKPEYWASFIMLDGLN